MYAVNLLILATCLIATAAAAPGKIIVCTYPSRRMNISEIDPHLCTHLIYGFVGIKDDDIEILSPYADLADNFGEDGFARVNALRQKNRSLKTIISVLCADMEYDDYTKMAANSTAREKFADNAAKFTKRLGFDGMNFFWNYVYQSKDPPRNVRHDTALLRALRVRFDKEGLILSAFMVASEMPASQSYNIAEVSKYLDLINLETYDFSLGLGTQTAITAALRAQYDDSSADRKKSVEASVLYWLYQGAPRSKLIVGVPTMGSSFILANASQNGIGAPSIEPGTAGRDTKTAGVLSYYEVCQLHKSDGWHIVFDEERRVPYTFKENRWIGYENVKSVKEKAAFIARLDLGGAMLSRLDHEDFRGACGKRYPLLRTLNAVLRNSDSVVEDPESPASNSSTPECVKYGPMRDQHSCGLIMCVPNNSTGGYVQYRLECSPGNCYNPTLGKMHADSVDPNFIILGA